MLRGGEVNNILCMKREGLSTSHISELLGLDRKTVRKYLLAPEVAQYGPRQKRAGKLDPYKPYVEVRLKAGVWNACVLLRELRKEGYEGGYSILKEYLAPRRSEGHQVAVRRFETPPGQQAQVDWGDIGIVEFGTRHQRLSCFVMTLGYSRALFVGIATDQKLATLLKMHEEAFRALGGVPKEILYDRPKTVVTHLDERGEPVLQTAFLDFTRYYGFTPRLCRAYRPQTKGKVESGVGYIRKNFLCGREANSVADLSSQCRVWTAEVANARIHGTTFKVVRDAHQEEQAHLQPLLSQPPYPCDEQEDLLEKRRVARDCYIAYRSNRYSVPFTAVGQDVAVREVEGKLEVLLHGERLTVHPLSLEHHQVIRQEEHHAGIPVTENDRAGGKARITIRAGAPEVEARSLAEYEAIAHEAIAHEAIAHEGTGQEGLGHV